LGLVAMADWALLAQKKECNSWRLPAFLWEVVSDRENSEVIGLSCRYRARCAEDAQTI
jgi:hypothetical protein